MKKYTTIILAGLVIVLAAVLMGALTYIRNQTTEVRAVKPLVKITPMEPDLSIWGVNFPNQYDTFMKTKTNNIDTSMPALHSFPGWNATRVR